MAPRLLLNALQRRVRGVLAGLCLVSASAGVALGCTIAPHQATQMPESLSEPWPDQNGLIAWYSGPTTRYTHGVLGDAIEGTRLHAYSGFSASICGDHMLTLPEELVFEDTAPRMADLDGDGRPEIIVVQSHQRLGAQLAVYRAVEGTSRIDLVATTPFIGRSNRWLAPIGAADMDGDGLVEVAYIDRPHLTRRLRVWRFEGGALTEVATLDDLTNHRIGEPFITGGVRTCDGTVEMITANRGWSHVMATRLMADTLQTRPLGAFSADTIAAALACRI